MRTSPEGLPAPAPLAGILRDGIEFLAETAASQGVAQYQDRAPGLPAFIRANSLRVRQILLNLLGDALNLTLSGGRVTLSVTRHPGAFS